METLREHRELLIALAVVLAWLALGLGLTRLLFAQHPEPCPEGCTCLVCDEVRRG